MSNPFARVVNKPKLIKLDFGCGPHKREGYLGVDVIKFDGVDYCVDLSKENWPFEDETVEAANTSHFVEHLTAYERVIFANELYRILIDGGKCDLVVPHWASCRAYGDPTHQWPPVSEFWFYYLNKEWRDTQAPHTDIKFNPKGFNCDFEVNYGYNIKADVQTRNQEYQSFAINNYKEVCQDMIAVMTKKPIKK